VPETDRPRTELEAIGWLVREVPELEPLLREHIADNEETLPYVVFEGDFLRWFTLAVRAGESSAPRRFVAAVEPLLSTAVRPASDDRVWNLAAVCFVDGLVMPDDDDVVEIARAWMSPNTFAEIDRFVQPPARRG
jgi:hypothetical protein